MPKRDTNQIALGLQMENEVQKLRLAAAYGAVSTSSHRIPLCIEQSWLKRLESVEEEFANAKVISVASYLGFPTYISEHRLSDLKLSSELERIKNELEQAGIEVSTLYPVSKRAMYRYLTEELLWEEIHETRMKGINHQFVYEEYYPNAEFEIEHTVVEFFDMLFGKYYSMLESIIYTDGGELSEVPETARMVDRLCDFTDAFDQIYLDEFRLLELTNDGDRACVNVHVSFTAHPNATGKGFTFQGPARFELKLDRYESWSITWCEIPGVYVQDVL